MATKTLVDTDSSQTLTNKTLTAPTVTAGVVALAAAPTATLDAATKGYVDAQNINPLNNGSLAASVSSNALTLSLKTAGGSTPSASDPVRVTFRNSTDADGSVVTRTVTGATSMTFSSGSTLGMSNGDTRRIWVGLLDNSGTVEVCAWNPLLNEATRNLKAFTPNTDVTTTAEGSGTATSAQVLYSTNARSNVPFILLGFIEITEATAGVWATAPSVVQTYRDGYRKTGDIVQTVRNTLTTVSTGTTITPSDDTIPQITEGDEYLTQAITPTSTINTLVIEAQTFTANNNAGNTFRTLALHQDATANALASAGQTGGQNIIISAFIKHLMGAGTVSSTTFRLRVGTGAAGTTTVNGSAGGRFLGGVLYTYITVTEVYV